MLRRLLFSAVTLGILVCGATIGLEAMGLLFRVGPPDSQQRIEAFLALFEASLGPDAPDEEPPIDIDIPDEPPPEPPPEPLWTSTEPPVPVAPGVDGEKTGPVEALTVEERRPLLTENAAPIGGGPLSTPSVVRGPLPPDLPKAGPEPTFETTKIAAASKATDCGAPCLGKTVADQRTNPRPAPQRLGRPERGKAPRSTATGGGGLGCPVLDWFDAVMAPPPGPTRRSPS